VVLKIPIQYKESRIEIKSVGENGGKYLAYTDRSPFYPEGKGGQLGDKGKIGNAEVLNVKEHEEGYIIELSNKIEPGVYEISIDQLRRKDIAQQHTGQHILSAAFVEVADIETVSFHMGEEYSTIDLDIPFIEQDVIFEAEDIANRIIQSCLAVEEIMTDYEGAKAYNLRKPVSDKVKGEVRLIKIGDFDISACGGFHTENTGEVGLIKIIDIEKVKGNLTRIYAVAGQRALRYFRKYNVVLKELSRQLTSSIDELNLRTEKLINQLREQSSVLSKISQDYAQLLSDSLAENTFIYMEGYAEVGNFLAKKIKDAFLVYFDGSKYIIASKMYDVRVFVNKLIEAYGGKGGGKPEFANYQVNKKLTSKELELLFRETYN
jgi:alanyl-tRNA synthetase